MKKFLLIIFLSLLGFTSFAFTVENSCLKHRIVSGVNSHIAVVTLNGTAGASMSLYYLGWYYGTEISVTSLGGGNWAYEFIIGGYTTDPHCHPDYTVAPTGVIPIIHTPITLCHCDVDIKDACVTRRLVNGQAHQIAKIVYGPDVQGVNQYLWYWDPAIPGFAGPYWPTNITPNGTNWVYEYDLGVIPGLISPLQLYTTYDYTLPPTSESDPHIDVKGCGANIMYACYEKEYINGQWRWIFTVAYDQGMVGMDNYIWIYNTTTLSWVAISGLPLSKIMVNGVWKYTYDLGVVDPQHDIECFDVYPVSVATPTPSAGSDPHIRGCKCECNTRFSYCINPADPYKVMLKFDVPNPLATVKISIDGSVVYQGPQLDIVQDFLVPSNREVCVERLDVQCDRYCLRICVAEQKR